MKFKVTITLSREVEHDEDDFDTEDASIAEQLKEFYEGEAGLDEFAEDATIDATVEEVK